MEDFTLNDMIDFFSASGSGVNVVVMDDVVVLEKEKKEMKENKDMDLFDQVDLALKEVKEDDVRRNV